MLRTSVFGTISTSMPRVRLRSSAKRSQRIAPNEHVICIDEGEDAVVPDSILFFIDLLLVKSLSSPVLICQIAIDRRSQPKTAGYGKNLSGGIAGGITGKIAHCFCDFFRQFLVRRGVVISSAAVVLLQIYVDRGTGKDGICKKFVMIRVLL